MKGQATDGAGRGKWMALLAALLGWMFDGLEMGLFPLVARPALQDLLQVKDDKAVGLWFGVATASFLVGAATGGVLFGWLGDRIGRVRAMMLSVFTYAIFSGACGFATSAVQITVLRFISALGMGGEWSLGVALVMEIWPDRSRAFLAGLIGAAANVGFMLIALLSMGLGQVLSQVESLLRSTGLSESWVQSLVANNGWRLLLMSGALPALLTFFIRLFVPESTRWEEEKARGSTSHWATQDLLGVLVGAMAACLLIYLWAAQLPMLVRIGGSIPALAVVTLGYLYPVIRYLRRVEVADLAALKAAARKREATLDPYTYRQEMEGGPVKEEEAGTAPGEWRGGAANILNDPGYTTSGTLIRMLLGAGLGGVALLGTWASIQWAPLWADKLAGGQIRHAKDYTQIASAGGAILGTIAAAVIGGWLGRRITYVFLCLASLGSVLLFYQGNHTFGWQFLASIFLAGGVTASFYGWLPLYLPELFRTRVRATGQGFSFNFGRILAAIGALQGGYLVNQVYQGDYPTVCSIMSLIYLVGILLVWLVPETRGKPLPD